MPNLRHSIARTAAILTDPGTGQRLTLRTDAIVTSIDLGGVVTVTIGADDIEAPRLDGWTPEVDDPVAVLLVNGSPLILGRVTGAPDIT